MHREAQVDVEVLQFPDVFEGVPVGHLRSLHPACIRDRHGCANNSAERHLPVGHSRALSAAPRSRPRIVQTTREYTWKF